MVWGAEFPASFQEDVMVKCFITIVALFSLFTTSATACPSPDWDCNPAFCLGAAPEGWSPIPIGYSESQILVLDEKTGIGRRHVERECLYSEDNDGMMMVVHTSYVIEFDVIQNTPVRTADRGRFFPTRIVLTVWGLFASGALILLVIIAVRNRHRLFPSP